METTTTTTASCKLFLGGISWDTSEATLREHFGNFGSIVDCVIMSDPHTHRPRGFGFVTFDNARSALEASREHFQLIDGRKVEVKSAVPKEAMAAKIRTKKVFVGGVQYNVTDDDLREHFKHHGNVLDAQIIRDHATAKSRGFGYVTFDDEDTVERVITLNHRILGKDVDVKKAVPKNTNLLLSNNNNKRQPTTPPYQPYHTFSPNNHHQQQQQQQQHTPPTSLHSSPTLSSTSGRSPILQSSMGKLDECCVGPGVWGGCEVPPLLPLPPQLLHYYCYRPHPKPRYHSLYNDGRCHQQQHDWPRTSDSSVDSEISLANLSIHSNQPDQQQQQQQQQPQEFHQQQHEFHQQQQHEFHHHHHQQHEFHQQQQQHEFHQQQQQHEFHQQQQHEFHQQQQQLCGFVEQPTKPISPPPTPTPPPHYRWDNNNNNNNNNYLSPQHSPVFSPNDSDFTTTTTTRPAGPRPRPRRPYSLNNNNYNNYNNYNNHSPVRGSPVFQGSPLANLAGAGGGMWSDDPWSRPATTTTTTTTTTTAGSTRRSVWSDDGLYPSSCLDHPSGFVGIGFGALLSDDLGRGRNSPTPQG